MDRGVGHFEDFDDHDLKSVREIIAEESVAGVVAPEAYLDRLLNSSRIGGRNVASAGALVSLNLHAADPEEGRRDLDGGVWGWVNNDTALQVAFVGLVSDSRFLLEHTVPLDQASPEPRGPEQDWDGGWVGMS